VPQHKAVAHHVFFDGRNGAAHARSDAAGSHRRQQQDAGIEQLRSVGLDERILLAIKAVFADIAADGVAQGPPAIERRLEFKSFSAFDARSNATHVITLEKNIVLSHTALSQMP